MEVLENNEVCIKMDNGLFGENYIDEKRIDKLLWFVDWLLNKMIKIYIIL